MSYKTCSSTTSESVKSSIKKVDKTKNPSELQKMDKKNNDESTPKVLLRAPKLIAKINSSQPKIFPLSKSDNSNSPISLFQKLLMTDFTNEPWGFAALAMKPPIDMKTEASCNKKDKSIAGFVQLRGLYDGLSHFYSTPIQSRTRPRSDKDKDSKVSSKVDPKVTCVDNKLNIFDQQSPSFLVKSAVSSKMMEIKREITREIAGSGGEQKLDDKSLENSPSAFRDRLSVPTIRPVTRSGKQVPYKILLVLASCIKYYHNS